MSAVFRFSVLLFFLILLTCASREEGVGTRNNPCDPGGAGWTVNALPEVNVQIDSLWVDFDHSDSTGSRTLTVAIDDRNFPLDSVDGTVVTGSRRTMLPRFSEAAGCTLQIDRIRLGSIEPCSVIVFDSHHDSVVVACTLGAAEGIPPLPPSPVVVQGAENVTFYWRTAAGATSYSVMKAEKKTGPYTPLRTVLQPSIDTVFFIDTPSYNPRYYRFASHGGAGASFLRDTLMGRRYYPGITAPSLSSVSRGEYTTHISLSAYISGSYLKYVEIYRSIGDTSSFELIDTVMLYSSSGSIYYNDSAAVGDTCFYRLIAVDRQGQCSRPGAAAYGFLMRLPAPFNTTLVAYNDYLRITWERSSSAAAYYRIYRSPISCDRDLVLLAAVYGLSYSDTTPVANYFYTIRAVDVNGLEGIGGSCVSGRITLLSAPGGFTVSDGEHLHYVTLSWQAVEGATGYMIRRGDPGQDSIIATVLENGIVDSVKEFIPYYYRVAAVDARGTGQFTGLVRGGIIRPPSLGVKSYGGYVELSWAPHPESIRYYVYRSENQTDYTLLDSTPALRYIDSITDFDPHYYRIAMLTDEGVAGPGATVMGQRVLDVPLRLSAKEVPGGIMLTWGRVPYAEKYNVHRSPTTSDFAVVQEITDTSYLDTSSSAVGNYYCVTAVATGTESRRSDYVYAVRFRPPDNPTIISVIGRLDDIQLTWSIGAASATPSGYYIYRVTAAGGAFVCIDTVVNTVYFDTVPDSVVYYYKVAAFNSTGTSIPTQTLSAQLIHPVAPSNIRASLGTLARFIKLTWSPVADVPYYCIFRSTSTGSGVRYQYVGWTSGSEYFDSTCATDTLYYYYLVVSQTEVGMRGVPAYDVKGARLGPPALSSINSSAADISFSWQPLPYPVERYYIYRSNSPTGVFVKYDSTSATAYTDDAPLASINYYKIATRNGEESAPSAGTLSCHLFFPASPAFILATQGLLDSCINITWPAVIGATGYRLYRSPVDSFVSGAVLIGETAGTSYIDSVRSDSMYFYRVKAFNVNGESALCDSVSAGYRSPMRKASAPTGLSVRPEAEGLRIVWNKPSTAVGYSGFSVLRSSSETGPFEIIATTTTNSFLDTPPLSYPAVYWYSINAENQMGSGISTAAVSGSRN